MIEHVMVFVGMLLIATWIEPLAERLRVPFTALLVVVGFVGSEVITGIGIDTGFRWHDFHTLILHVLVPVLVFESAFNMHARALLRNIVPVLFLAIPAMLIAAALTGVAVYYGIHHPIFFPLTAALLTGVIVSATDPVAVIALLKKLGAPVRLNVLLEGESLFNDATAIVLFTVLLSMLSMPADHVSASAVACAFFKSFLGGVCLGTLLGALASLFYRVLKQAIYHSVMSIAVACFTFYLSEHVLQVSGVVGVLCAGLFLGDRHRHRASSDTFTPELWQFAAYIANAILFLLVGVTVTWVMFESQWLAMLIGIVAATLARAIVIYGLYPLLSCVPGMGTAPVSYRHVMMWGGLRGAVSLALALSLPTTIESWFTIQSIAYGVVLFTLFIQTPLVAPLVQRAVADRAV